MYSALDIAIYIISKCNIENYPINNLQLQKSFIICRKLYYKVKLGLQRKRVVLFFGDKIEAWQ